MILAHMGSKVDSIMPRALSQLTRVTNKIVRFRHNKLYFLVVGLAMLGYYSELALRCC
jgi:cytochrome b561